MTQPVRYHLNILIDSRRRAAGTPGSFEYVLGDAVRVPTGATAFLTCTRWTVDVSGITLADRAGRPLQLHVNELDTAGRTLDMSRGGVPVSCVAYIPTIHTAFDIARMSSLGAHPVAVPAGLNMRRFGVSVLNGDGTVCDDCGEWEADLAITVSAMPPGVL